MADHTTLPSRGLSLRPVGKSREAPNYPYVQNPYSSKRADLLPVCPRKGTLPPDLRTTPAANSSRTPPSRPRASARSRASAIPCYEPIGVAVAPPDCVGGP